MPLYEYECQKCHRRVEKIQSFSADPLTTCEHCGGPLEKLISAPAFQFKGSGWYVTDYAKSGSARSSGHDKKSGDGDSGSGSSSGSDAKPASTDAGSPAQGASVASKPASATPDK